MAEVVEPQKRILMVEDEALIALSRRIQLERLGGYLVYIASTGELAIKLNQTHSPDLILMDISLASSMDGIEAAGIIAAASKVPIIFSSSHPEAEITRRVEDMSRYSYLSKTVSSKEFLRVISSALEKSTGILS